MKIVIQRVIESRVTVDGEEVSNIGHGLLVLVGVVEEDTEEDINWISNKIVSIRLFDDEQAIPNLSVKDIDGEILLVSQFTLHARTRKGHRPSFIDAARPETAIPIYEALIKRIEFDFGKKIQTGRFGKQMRVFLENEGPVTIIVDSKDKGQR